MIVYSLLSRHNKCAGIFVEKPQMKMKPELETLELWISGLMLNPLFFLFSRLNIACSPLFFNLQINYPIRIKARISHSKVFSSVVVKIRGHRFNLYRTGVQNIYEQVKDGSCGSFVVWGHNFRSTFIASSCKYMINNECIKGEEVKSIFSGSRI